MWTASNGGSPFDEQGNPALDSAAVQGMLEFWKKLKATLPPGWASHDYLETLSAWATGKTAQVLMWGRTSGYIDQYAPAEKRNPETFQIWPKTIGPNGKAPLTQFDNEPWILYADTSADEKAACKEFLKFFFKGENYRRYCDSVPIHLNSIFKADFQDSSYLNHPDRKRWKPWIVHVLPGGDRGRAVERHARHAAHGGHDLLHRLSLGDGRREWLDGGSGGAAAPQPSGRCGSACSSSARSRSTGCWCRR